MSVVAESMQNLPEFLREIPTAKLLDVAPQTLRLWRSTKRVALPYLKIGGSIRYPRAALVKFLEQQMNTPEAK